MLEMLSRSLMSIMAAAAEVVVGGSTSLSLSLPPLQWPSGCCSGEKGNPAWAVAFTEAGTDAEAAEDLGGYNNGCETVAKNTARVRAQGDYYLDLE